MKWFKHLFRKSDQEPLSEKDKQELKEFVRSATVNELFDKQVQHYLQKEIEYLSYIAPYDKAAKAALKIKTGTTSI